MTVVDASPTIDSARGPDNVLNERLNCEWHDEQNGFANYYITCGDTAFMIFDMGCQVFMTNIEIRNSGNHAKAK